MKLTADVNGTVVYLLANESARDVCMCSEPTIKLTAQIMLLM